MLSYYLIAIHWTSCVLGCRVKSTGFSDYKGLTWNYSHSLPPILSRCSNRTAQTRWWWTIDLDVQHHKKCLLIILSQWENFSFTSCTEGTNTFPEYSDPFLDKSSHIISSNTITLENRTQYLNFVEMQSCVW